MITAVIVSKDRACQLDALLQSIEKYAPGIFDIHIMFKTSNEEYLGGYQILWQRWWDKVELHKEITFKDTLCHIVKNSKSLCCQLLTDDSLWFRPFTFTDEELFTFFCEYNCWSFAPRCGFNTQQQCHWSPIFQDKIEPVRDFGNVIMWDFTKHSYATDYGRPISLDGNIHPREMLLEEMIKHDWNWCGGLDALPLDRFKPYLASYKESCMVNIPMNSTHGAIADNWGKFHSYTFEELNQRFLDGQRIDIDSMNFDSIIGGHQELPLKFKKI